MKSRFCMVVICLVWAVLARTEVLAASPHRIAWLGAGTSDGSAEFVDVFKDGLKDQGLVEGKDYVFDAVYADNRYERFPSLVRQLLSRNPSVIMAVTVASVRAAQQATRTVPIVMMTTNDPVAAGLVASLARPGGNTTGLGNMAEDITEKYIQLTHEFSPRAKNLVVLTNPGNSSHKAIVEKLRVAGQTRGLATQAVPAAGDRELRSVFAEIAARRADAVVLASDFSLLDRRGEICALALEFRIPLLGYAPEFADAGCLAGIGSSRRYLFRHSATYVKKILAGAQPQDLPVELPVRFELAINIKTARTLRLDVPSTTLLRADRVVE